MTNTLLSSLEVSQHASSTSCWIIIQGEAYDVTNFLDTHPGGKQVILKLAGGDATGPFEEVHSKDLLIKYKSQM
jgi:L-lactate dehydrogenase (cytochrome)